MKHEKEIIRADSTRIRIIVESRWAGKYTWRIKVKNNRWYLKPGLYWLYAITDEEILQAKIELWEKLKPQTQTHE